MLRAGRLLRRDRASRLLCARDMDAGRKLFAQPLPSGATSNRIMLCPRWHLHRHYVGFLRLHVDAKPRLLAQPVRHTATGYRRVLRGGWHLLRDDADWLLQHRRRLSRRGDFLHARPVRHTAATADRLVLRAFYKRMLRFHRINVRDYFGNVDDWRRLSA